MASTKINFTLEIIFVTSRVTLQCHNNILNKSIYKQRGG